MVESLMLAFGITARTVGEISGSYFYMYALMQFPVGLLMDRFGAHRLLTFASLLCGLSVILFAFSPNVELLIIARLLVALGSSFAWVGLLYITSHYFHKRQIALLIGIANSFAMVGGIAGEGPISFFEFIIGWRLTVAGMGVFGLILALLIYLIVHKQAEAQAPKKHSVTFKGAWNSLLTVLRNGQAWLNAFVGLFIYATTTGFAALWGVDFLEKNHNLSRDVGGFASSMVYVGYIIGGPIIGHLSDYFENRRIFLLISTFCGGVVLLPLILLVNLHLYLIFTILIFVGIFSSAELLNFTHAMELFSRKATGSATAFTNFVIVLGGAFFQPFVGFLLDFFWGGKYINGVKDYSPSDFRLATLCFPICFFIAFILSFFIKEKKST